MNIFKKLNIKLLSQIIGILILLSASIFAIYLYKHDYFSDINSLRIYINSFGIYSAIIFVCIQISQAIFAIIPGGISCVAGVVLFGNLKGFILNYIGIVLGSFLAFYISRTCGRPFIEKLFNKKTIEKYDKYTNDQTKFNFIFAAMILLPGLPDDLLCYIAGTTKIKTSTFIKIILILKIPSLAMYSLGIYFIFEELLKSLL